MFFVNLPNGEERRKILDIHLRKRNKYNRELDLISLIKVTEGFNGADLEAVVKDTIEGAFIDERNIITTQDLLKSINDTKSISKILGDKIKEIENAIKNMDIKQASNKDMC